MAEKYSGEEDVENENLLSDGEEARVSDDGTREEEEEESEDDAILVRKVIHPSSLNK